VIVRSDPSVPESVLINQVVAQNLAAVGVDVEMTSIPGTRWLGFYFSGDWSGADMLETSFNNSIHGDAIRSIETASCLKPGAYFCDEDLLPLIEASNRDFNPVTREKKLQELVTALHNNPPALYLFPYFDTMAYSPRLNDLPVTGQRVNLEQIRIRD
jgi:peptide/nickel transport system substrate-binding protein